MVVFWWKFLGSISTQVWLRWAVTNTSVVLEQWSPPCLNNIAYPTNNIIHHTSYTAWGDTRGEQYGCPCSPPMHTLWGISNPNWQTFWRTCVLMNNTINTCNYIGSAAGQRTDSDWTNLKFKVQYLNSLLSHKKFCSKHKCHSLPGGLSYFILLFMIIVYCFCFS